MFFGCSEKQKQSHAAPTRPAAAGSRRPRRRSAYAPRSAALRVRVIGPAYAGGERCGFAAGRLWALRPARRLRFRPLPRPLLEKGAAGACGVGDGWGHCPEAPENDHAFWRKVVPVSQPHLVWVAARIRLPATRPRPSGGRDASAVESCRWLGHHWLMPGTRSGEYAHLAGRPSGSRPDMEREGGRE